MNIKTISGRNDVSDVFDLYDLRVKVVASEIGGGFGGKTTVYLEPVALILSKKSGRPVKMEMSRGDVFRASGPASASQSRIKIGAKMDGTITAMQATLHYEAGAFQGSPMGPGCMTVFTPYDVENLYVCLLYTSDAADE